jgi:hypothetical protein
MIANVASHLTTQSGDRPLIFVFSDFLAFLSHLNAAGTQPG